MSNIIIPSNEEDRKKIFGVIKEISNSLTRIEGERGYINEALKELAEDTDIPKKYLRQMAKLYHKQNFTEAKAEFEDVETLYEAVTK